MDTKKIDLFVIDPNPSVPTNLVDTSADESLCGEFIDKCLRAIAAFIAGHSRKSVYDCSLGLGDLHALQLLMSPDPSAGTSPRKTNVTPRRGPESP